MRAATIDARQWADDVVDTIRLTSTGVRIVRALAALGDAEDVIAPGRADLAARARCEPRNCHRDHRGADRRRMAPPNPLRRAGPGDRAAYRLAAPDPEATP